MKAIELIGDIDEQHRLQASVPEELPAGPVRLIVLLPDEDSGGISWAHGLAQEWADIRFLQGRQDNFLIGCAQPITLHQLIVPAQLAAAAVPARHQRIVRHPSILLTIVRRRLISTRALMVHLTCGRQTSPCQNETGPVAEGKTCRSLKQAHFIGWFGEFDTVLDQAFAQQPTQIAMGKPHNLCLDAQVVSSLGGRRPNSI